MKASNASSAAALVSAIQISCNRVVLAKGARMPGVMSEVRSVMANPVSVGCLQQWPRHNGDGRGSGRTRAQPHTLDPELERFPMDSSDDLQGHQRKRQEGAQQRGVGERVAFTGK